MSLKPHIIPWMVFEFVDVKNQHVYVALKSQRITSTRCGHDLGLEEQRQRRTLQGHPNANIQQAAEGKIYCVLRTALLKKN